MQHQDPHSSQLSLACLFPGIALHITTLNLFLEWACVLYCDLYLVICFNIALFFQVIACLAADGMQIVARTKSKANSYEEFVLYNPRYLMENGQHLEI